MIKYIPFIVVIFMNVYFGPIVPFVVVLIVVVGVVVEFGFLVTFLRVWSLSGRRHSISPKVFDPLCHGRWQFFHLSNNIIVTSALYKCQTYNLISSTRLSNNALQWSFKGGRITSPKSPVIVISYLISLAIFTFWLMYTRFITRMSSTHKNWLKCKKYISFFTLRCKTGNSNSLGTWSYSFLVSRPHLNS